jgi:phenylpropionate dioxygenase-like ring-hydroxylating dioxygenase large terminal subunit
MIAQASQFPESFAPPGPGRRGAPGLSQKPLGLDEICARISEVADLPLTRASTIPAQAYTSGEFFEWEIDHLLRSDWQCVAHISQIPAPGDFLNIDLLGEPLIVVHGKEGAIRVLSRVCPHRAMDIMPQGFGYDGHGPAEVRAGSPHCGHTRLFLCPYHAWTFELDGKLKACPEMHQAESFSRDQVGLKPYQSAVWHGLIFVNLDGAAPPFDTDLDAMHADLVPYNLAGMKLVIAREWECEFNWKVLVENFMESYHHLGIHSKTLQPMMPARDTWTEQERRRYIRAHLPYKPELLAKAKERAAAGKPSGFPLLPDLRPDQKTEWGLFLLYPDTLLATTEDRVIWYRIQPLAPDRIRLLTTTLVAPDVFDVQDTDALIAEQAEMLYAFHLEDMEVCTAVQRGLHSSAWKPGRLSHLEMPVWLFHRYLAARVRGVWPTDDRDAAPAQR